MMTADEFRAALDSLGFTQEGFAARVGASGRTGRKWALGETRVPGSVAVLLRLLVARPELVPVLDHVAPPPEPRRRRGR